MKRDAELSAPEREYIKAERAGVRLDNQTKSSDQQKTLKVMESYAGYRAGGRDVFRAEIRMRGNWIPFQPGERVSVYVDNHQIILRRKNEKVSYGDNL